MFVITVPSSVEGESHTVRKSGDVWVCSCADHVYRARGDEYACKHLADLAFSLATFVAGARKSDAAERALRAPAAAPRFEDLELPAGV